MLIHKENKNKFGSYPWITYICGVRKSLLYGTLLGDSWIYKDKRGNFCFAFCQANKDYAKWKADLLGYSYNEYHVNRLDKRTGKTYSNLTIHVKIPVSDKRFLYETFYKPSKRVTRDILNCLDRQGIALWYLDDGSIYYNGNNCHLQLSVDGFPEEDQLLIIEYFKEVFNINFKKTKRTIRLVSKAECEKFMEIVEHYIPSCMEYKKLSTAIQKYKTRL